MFSAGRNNSGQLGLGNVNAHYDKFQKVPEIEMLQKLASFGFSKEI